MHTRIARFNTHTIFIAAVSLSILLLLIIFLIPHVKAHAQMTSLPTQSCTGNGCDNTDPYGQCLQISAADGSCANPYHNSETPAPGSCQSLGTRLAVNHAADAPAVLKTITTSTGEVIATTMLIYSNQCKTNWMNVVLQGRCAASASAPSPCQVDGYMSRTSKNQQDGNDISVAFLPPDASAMAHTAMLYAPDVPIQGCVTVTYTDGQSHIASPFVCTTQAGW